jgi:tetratricopeptide (TPR) repeat protein
MIIRARNLAILAFILFAGILCFGLVRVTSRPTAQRSKNLPPVPVSLPLNSMERSTDALHSIKALEKELQKKPNHVPILFQLAQLSIDMGKPADAEKYLREVLSQEPKNLDAKLELGRALYMQGNVDRALVETQSILDESPNHADALYNLGAIYGNIHNEEMARKYWKLVIASAPDSEIARRARQGLEQLRTSR